MANIEFMPVMENVNAFFDARQGVEQDHWTNLAGDIDFQLFNPINNADGVEVVGSETSYGKFTKPYVSGSSRTWYFVFKNVGGVYADWKTIIGNEADTNRCSTLAMDGNGYIKFTRQNIIPSTSLGYKCSDWHVVSWVSDASSSKTRLWIDGSYINNSSGMGGMADDTFLCRGSGWWYEDNNTVFRAIAISDSAQTDFEVERNSFWLYENYIANYSNDLEESTQYVIKESTLTSFGDQARRINGTTGKLTTAQMLEIFENAKVNSTLDGLSNGYDVMFYDENNEGLAFYSIKQGQAINPPMYSVSNWIDQNGVPIVFPYTPNADISLWANNSALSTLLYDHFAVSPEEYPYILINYRRDGIADSTLYFVKTFTTYTYADGSTVPNYNTCKFVGFTYKNTSATIEDVVEFIMANCTKDSLRDTSVGTYQSIASAYVCYVNHSLSSCTITNWVQFE